MFHSIRKASFRQGTSLLRSQSGQIGIILILLAAFGLLFYAITLNFNRASDLKTRTLMAAEASSALTASYLAGTAEKLSQEHLKGEAGYCDSSSWLEAVFKIILLSIVIVIAIIINIIPGVGSLVSALLWAVVIGAILAIVFTTISIILQITVVQPGITSMWNEMMAKTFKEIEDQVIEQGIQIAIQKLVDDPIELPDTLDFDNDGVYVVVNGGEIQDDEIVDSYARFAHYNTRRLQGVVGTPSHYVDEFLARLEDLVYLTPGGPSPSAPDLWGFVDGQSYIPPIGTCPNDASVCNPCCFPVAAACCGSCSGDPRCTAGLPPADVPPCCAVAACATEADQATCATSRPSYCGAEYPAKCYQRSFLYHDGDANDTTIEASRGLPFIFDPFYEGAVNNTMHALGGAVRMISFREWVGRDDVSDAYYVDPEPNDTVRWHSLHAAAIADSRQKIEGGVATAAQAFTNRFVLSLQDRFRPQDASGFYISRGDDQVGVFPLFYRMRDQLEFPTAFPGPYHLGCLWWNSTDQACNYRTLFRPEDQFTLPYAITAVIQYGGQTLTNSLGTPLRYADYAGEHAFIDMGFYNAPDRVRKGAINKLFAADDVCAEVAARPTVIMAATSAAQNARSNIKFPGIKQGADFYCSANYPYETRCLKHGSGCTETLWFERINDTTGAKEMYSQVFPVDCACGAAGAASADKWPDDFLDAFHKKITELKLLTAELSGLKMRGLLVSTFSDWYLKVADWIEPAYNKAACTANPASIACKETVTRKERWGYLWSFREHFREIALILNDWLNDRDETGATMSYQGANCFDAWCLPSPTCVMLSAEERRGYDNDANNVYNASDNGLTAVIKCMDWAATAVTNDLTYSAAVPPPRNNNPQLLKDASGNNYVGIKGKYQACLENCGTQYCDDLPRPFVPSYEVDRSIAAGADWRILSTPTIPAAAGDAVYLGTYKKCLRSLTVAQCVANTAATDECPDAPGYIAPDGQYTALIQSLTNLCPTATFVPVTQTCHDGSTLLIDCTTPQAQIDSCMRHLLNSCAWIVPGQTSPFYDNLIATTDCAPAIGANPETPYRQWLKANIMVAGPFVDKLTRRKDSLSLRRQQMIEARDKFNEAYNRITEFLDNGTPFDTPAADIAPTNCQADLGAGYQLSLSPTPAGYTRSNSLYTSISAPCAPRFPYNPTQTITYHTASFTGTNQDSPAEMLIDAQEAEKTSDALAAFAIYVWRGNPDDDPDWSDGVNVQNDGLLHAVKVEARIPRRCMGLCDYSGTGPVDWPKIETYTTGFLGSTRCYELRNHFGMTKARVIRFDQSPNISKFKLFNKIPFSLPNFSHPAVVHGANITGGDIFDKCAMHIDPLIEDLIVRNSPPKVPAVSTYLRQGFMINWQPKYILTAPPVGSQDERERICWDAVHEILRYGVQSASCANYYWGGSGGALYGNQGMRVKFTPCNQTFIESGDMVAPHNLPE